MIRRFVRRLQRSEPEDKERQEREMAEVEARLRRVDAAVKALQRSRDKGR
jgi:hypothetical protein